MDYRSTLNLPKTDFPMKAGLPQREPSQIQKWNDEKVYVRMISKRVGKPKFVLHDGPPYANGNIHLGHTLNKVLKDIVVKFKNLSGYYAEFVPGWDCHGLPIELVVEKGLREKKIDRSKMSVAEFRRHCREYAMSVVEKQREQFKGLEILADWDHPYLTASSGYVAQAVRELGKFSAAGNLIKGNKPVYWCSHCATALADAEIEYRDHTSPSIYVKFELTEQSVIELGKRAKTNLSTTKPVYVVIWTTTPWTLPANLAICANPEFEYIGLDTGKEILLVGEALKDSFGKILGDNVARVQGLRVRGVDLEHLETRHPFMNRISKLILGQHVTADAGTGLVHTAPGHGVDDFRVGQIYGLPAFAPIDSKGRFTAEVPAYQGLHVKEANSKIVADLKASNHLLHAETVQHSYPHCWRCESSVLFRATPQWFIGMEPTRLRERATEEIRRVEWIPAWGINRILGMTESRPDWCISRQRTWGIPITVFYCEKCNEALQSQKIFNAIADLIEEHGPDVWCEREVKDLFPLNEKCLKCGNNEPTAFRKENDILDVWFDSGISHAAVLEAGVARSSHQKLGKLDQSGSSWPADLYLEGSDQHRGWFQTSLLTSVETRGAAPFLKVLTHGFVNDKEGRKMSKSKGNATDPVEFSKKYGAEILRLWVVLEDYRNDVNFSMETIERVSESYRKIRNTFRFMLGNLFDFKQSIAGDRNPNDLLKNLITKKQLSDLDCWIVHRTAKFLSRIQGAYENYEFHVVYHALVNFCTVDLSAQYFDILKDRLYTSAARSTERVASQSVLFAIGNALAAALSPILSFTAEEVWTELGKSGSVFEADFPQWQEFADDEWLVECAGRTERILTYRETVNRELEQARVAKQIGHSLEAEVSLAVPNAEIENFRSTRDDLARLFIVSGMSVSSATDDAVKVAVRHAPGNKCARCWVFSSSVGKDADHVELCDRCVGALINIRMDS